MGSGRSLIAAAAVLASASASPARADEPPGDHPTVSAPASLVGDGKQVAPIVVVGGPPRKTRQLPVPEVATVTCAGASGLAASGQLPPAVLAPVATQRITLACTARLRDAEAPFQLEVQPAPAGLYASASETDVRSTAAEVHLDAFEWTGSARQPAAALRAGASDGTIAVRDGKLVLAQSGNAPRTVAIALADGEHVGAAFVPVTGVTTLPVEAEPGASVQFWLAGRWFGPVTASGRLAQVPIEVPPGVTHGIARATGRGGYVTDAITDLKVPWRPRIAAVVASAEVPVGGDATIAIAIAGDDGRPAPTTLSVTAAAKRGSLGGVTALGGGLWTVRYTAPGTAGPDHVTISAARDARAGTAELEVPIVAGRASRIELDVPPGPYEPSAELAGTARIFDASGNPLLDPAVTVSLAGAPLAVTREASGAGVAFHGRVPDRLPDSGELPLQIAVGAVHEVRVIQARGRAATATIDTAVDERLAIASLAVRDRYGNLVHDGAFEVAVTGATLERLARDPGAFRARLAADPEAEDARIEVRAGGHVLADDAVRFEPPPRAYVLGAWASGGYLDNLGVLASPRADAGLALRHGLAGLELAGLVGAEAVKFRDATPVTVGGVTQDAQRSLEGVGLSLAVRARVKLSRRLGAALGVGLVPTRVRVLFHAAGQSADEYGVSVLCKRVQLQGDLKLGPGRAFVSGAYGRGAVTQGEVVGQIDGLAVVGGYEWWFADFGW